MLEDDNEDEEGAGRAGGKQGVPNLMQMGEETAPGKGREALSPHLTHLAQAASLQSKVDVLFPSQYCSSKWVHVGLFHLQGTEVRLGEAILDPLRIRVYR